MGWHACVWKFLCHLPSEIHDSCPQGADLSTPGSGTHWRMWLLKQMEKQPPEPSGPVLHLSSCTVSRMTPRPHRPDCVPTAPSPTWAGQGSSLLTSGGGLLYPKGRRRVTCLKATHGARPHWELQAVRGAVSSSSQRAQHTHRGSSCRGRSSEQRVRSPRTQPCGCQPLPAPLTSAPRRPSVCLSEDQAPSTISGSWPGPRTVPVGGP